MILNTPLMTSAAIHPRRHRRRGVRQTLVVETGLDYAEPGAFRKLVDDLRARRDGFPHIQDVEIQGPNWRGWIA